jgi:DNA-binding transcriptional ArsR family regulator
LEGLLREVGRTLVLVAAHTWTTGYRDDVAAALTAQGVRPFGVAERAVLVLVLVHSVAIPRSAGTLDRDSWVSTHPTGVEELYKYSQLPRTEVRAALARLRAAGLVQLVPERGKGPGQGAAYLPGPQLQRLTPAALRRLQEDLVLAAAPDTPLAAAIRARRPRPGSLGPSHAGPPDADPPDADPPDADPPDADPPDAGPAAADASHREDSPGE